MAIRYLSGINVDSNTLFVDSANDRVGIGTTGPSAPLQVVAASPSNQGVLNISNTYASGGVYFPATKFKNNFGNHSFGIVSEFSTGSGGGTDRPSILFYSDVQASASWQVGQVTSGWGGNDSFGIGYRANGVPSTFDAWPTTYLLITTAGNTLIGTTTDNGNKLRVNGTIYADSTITSATSVRAIEGYFNPYTSAGNVATPVYQDAIFLGPLDNDCTIQFGNEFQSTHGSYIRFRTNSASAQNTPVNVMTMFPNGKVALNQYGAGTFTAGTPTYNLAVDASGNIIETAGGVVDGSGTANYVSKWSDANTLTDSVIYDNGTNVSIGTTANPGSRTNIYLSEAGAIPNSILRLQNTGSGYLAKMIITDGNTNDAVIGYQGGFTGATQYLGFGLGTSITQMVLNGSGNVGIGTTTPQLVGAAWTTLEVQGQSTGGGGIVYTANNGATVKSHFYTDGTSGFVGTQTNHYFGFTTNNQERGRFTAGGNLLIGTTTDAGYKLRVNGTGRYDDYLQLWSGTAGASPKLILGGETTQTDKSIFLESYYMVFQGHNNEGFKFQTVSSVGAVSNRMSILGTGTIVLSNYGSGSKTGTAAYALSVDSSGNVIESASPLNATSLYDLLPAGRVAYNWVGQVVNDAWTTVFTKNDNILTTGTWMVKMYVNDFSVGGGHYQYVYSGVMTWEQGTVNQTGEAAFSEVYLHRMGHAANASILYLRTAESGAAGGNIGYFQIKGNYSNTANQTIQFQFVKIF